jgi:hypothetical protein
MRLWAVLIWDGMTRHECEQPRPGTSWRHHPGPLWTSHVGGADRQSGALNSEDKRALSNCRVWYPAPGQTWMSENPRSSRSWRNSLLSFVSFSQWRVMTVDRQSLPPHQDWRRPYNLSPSSHTPTGHTGWCEWGAEGHKRKRCKTVLGRCLPCLSGSRLETFISVWTTGSWMLSPRRVTFRYRGWTTS